MKIAYLIVVHRDPRLLQRAIKVLSSQDSAFFIHVDRKSSFEEFSGFAGDNVFMSSQRISVHWAEYSQVDATLLLLRQALADRANYDYFVFLQGATYPLGSGRYIEQFFDANAGSEFMNLVKMPAPGYQMSKINAVRYPSSKPVRRFAARALGKIGLVQRDYRKYLPGLQAYAGHACWGLSRNACEYMVGFLRSNPNVEQYFRNTFTSDEMLFHTILGNSAFNSRMRKSFVYADWSRSAGLHPAALEDAHISFFESREKVWVEDEWGPGEMLFARKFSDDRLDLLDRVDAMISRKDRWSASYARKGER